MDNLAIRSAPWGGAARRSAWLPYALEGSSRGSRSKPQAHVGLRSRADIPTTALRQNLRSANVAFMGGGVKPADMTVGMKQMRELVHQHPVAQKVCPGQGLVDVTVDSIASPAHDLSPEHRLAALACGYHQDLYAPEGQATAAVAGDLAWTAGMGGEPVANYPRLLRWIRRQHGDR